jgi:hypothetical protein
MALNIDNKLSVVVNTLNGSFCIAYLIGYFVKKDLLGEVELNRNTLFLQEIVEQFKVPLM